MDLHLHVAQPLGHLQRPAAERGRLVGQAIEVAGSRRLVHQVGLIWHFGYEGQATGDSANLLTPNIGDANTMIPEYKAFLCQVRKVTGVNA